MFFRVLRLQNPEISWENFQVKLEMFKLGILNSKYSGGKFQVKLEIFKLEILNLKFLKS